MGCLCSGMTLAPVISTMSAGPMVMERNAAQAMVKVLVKASGLNRRPSCASSVNTGMKLTVMTSRAKNSGLPSCLQAVMMISCRCWRLKPGGACSSCLWTFSTITTASSQSTPMEMAMPASDMMLAVSPMKYIGMKASATAMGSVTMARAAPPKSSRNTMTMIETMMDSSMMVRVSVWMERLIRSERS